MSSSNILPDEYLSVNNNCTLRTPGFMKGLSQPLGSAGLPAILVRKESEHMLRHEFNILEDELPTEDQPCRELFTKIINKGLPRDSMEVGHIPAAPTVVVVGAGCGGLSAAFELKRGGVNVVLLESSQGVGGRIKTYGAGTFASPLHCEGGAMRIPNNNWLTTEYLKLLGLEKDLEKFEQTNRVIYLRGLGKALPYHIFEKRLKEKDSEILKLFPNLKERERGKTVDELWNEALAPVHKIFFSTYAKAKDVTEAYGAVTKEFDRYTLKGFFEDYCGWSADAIRLYSLSHAIVVLDNGFMEVWKDEFLSSPKAGEKGEMKSLKGGMERFTQAFLYQETPFGKLDEDVRYGARVFRVDFDESRLRETHDRVTVHYYDSTGKNHKVHADYVVFAVPYTSIRLIEMNPPFDLKKSHAIHQARYVNVTKVLLQFKKRWWEKWLVDNEMIPPHDAGSMGGGLVTDLPIRHVMFPNHQYDMFKHTERGVLMVAYTFQQDADILAALPQADIIREAKRCLVKIVGDENIIEDNFESGIVHSWGTDPAGGGSAFVFFGPNHKTQLHDDICRAQWQVTGTDGVEYAAHFAGEHASFSHAWIQGAFESGVRVAYLIHKSAKLS